MRLNANEKIAKYFMVKQMGVICIITVEKSRNVDIRSTFESRWLPMESDSTLYTLNDLLEPELKLIYLHHKS
jgi:hypothetical protein